MRAAHFDYEPSTTRVGSARGFVRLDGGDRAGGARSLAESD